MGGSGSGGGGVREEERERARAAEGGGRREGRPHTRPTPLRLWNLYLCRKFQSKNT